MWIYLLTCIGYVSCDLIESIILSEQQKSAIVIAHNNVRLGLCAPNITYDENLAYVASMHAEKCILSNNDRFIGIGNGENTNVIDYGWSDLSIAVRDWTREKNNFVCGNGVTNSTKQYVQIINAPTTKIGCGAARCVLNNESSLPVILLVCNYNPGLGINSNKQCVGCSVQSTNNTSVFMQTTTPLPVSTTVQTTTPTTTPTTVGTTSVDTTLTTLPTTTSTTTQSVTTTEESAQKDICMMMRNICWEQCGKPEIFPFLDSCTKGLDGKIFSCASPPNCTCEIPLELRSEYSALTTCSKYTCRAFYPTAGTLNWCRHCGYNCGGFQTACIENEGFCNTPTYCSKLNMCSDWRESNCRINEGGKNDDTCDRLPSFIMNDQQLGSNNTTLSNGTNSYTIGLAVVVAICGLVALLTTAYICTVKILEKRGVRPVMRPSKVENPDFDIELMRRMHDAEAVANEVVKKRTSVSMPISRQIHVEDTETLDDEVVYREPKVIKNNQLHSDVFDDNSTYD